MRTASNFSARSTGLFCSDGCWTARAACDAVEEDELLDEDKVQLESLETSGRTVEPVSKMDELLFIRISLSLTVEQSESRWLLLDVTGGRSYELDLTIPSVVIAGPIGFLLFSNIESRRLCVSNKFRATLRCSRSETCDRRRRHSPCKFCKCFFIYFYYFYYFKKKIFGLFL